MYALFGQTTTSSMVLDSGATSHFFRAEDHLPILGPSHERVQMPNGKKEDVAHKAKLPYPMLSDKAREAHVLPALAHHSLLSIPTLADEGYTTIFHAGNKGAEVYKATDVFSHNRGPPVLQGCHKGKSLWTISSHDTAPATDTANNVYILPSTEKAIRFLHAAAGFPVKATWIEAIKN